jgi:hypothetical protein
MDYIEARDEMEIDIRRMDTLLLECLKKFKSDMDMKPVLRVMKERIQKHKESITNFEETYKTEILST